MNDFFSGLEKAKTFENIELLEAVDRLPTTGVAVIGDIGIDQYTVGEVSRISPEAPVPVLEVSEQTQKLGLAANVSHNISQLGCANFLLGVMGEDGHAEVLTRLLKDRCIDASSCLRVAGRPTSLKERIVASRQQIVRVDYEKKDPISAESQDLLLSKLDDLAKSKSIQAIIIEDYAKGVIHSELVSRIVSLKEKYPLLISCDPHPDVSLETYRGVDLITPNLKEAELLTGCKIKDLESFRGAVKILQDKTAASSIVVTLGEWGMCLVRSGQEPQRVPTAASEVFDVSGAGDTAVSVLTLGLMGGEPIEKAMALANAASGIVVGKYGTATVSREELKSIFS